MSPLFQLELMESKVLLILLLFLSVFLNYRRVLGRPLFLQFKIKLNWWINNLTPEQSLKLEDLKFE